MKEYAVEYEKSGIVVRAESEEEAIRIAWAYKDMRKDAGGDKSKLTVREIGTK